MKQIDSDPISEPAPRVRDADTEGPPVPVSNPVQNPVRSKKYSFRKLFWKWHLYAGLLGGPLLILIAVTGALLVFSPEIDAWLRPDLWKIDPGDSTAVVRPISDQSLVETVMQRFPEERLIFYQQNDEPDKPYQFLLFGDLEKGIHDVWVNPYTGVIVADRMRETAFVRIIEQLHRRLLTGEVGSSIVELITGWGIVLTLTGCFLWWPRTARALWNGLTLTFRGSAYKVNWRLHNTVGAWVGLFVLLMCLTGMVFSTYSGKIYFALMKATDHKAAAAPLKSEPIPGQEQIDVDQLLEQVYADVPAETPLLVQWPRDETGCFMIRTYRETRPLWSDQSNFRGWTFDQYSGALLESERWAELHPMRQFASLSMSIHYGSLFGLPTRLIALVACLAVPLLSVTGYLIWWWKRKGKQKKTKSSPSKPRANQETQPIPKTLIALLVLVGIIFPTIGVSFLVLALYEGVRYWLQTRKAVTG